MLIHADFSQPVIVTPQDHQWVKSPGGEVKRMMLERIGEEKARATSLVEFSPHSKFPPHTHPFGEEMLVLSGIFTEDHHQHYPAGWYMRNPHQSHHQVSSESGCQIFVKLMQMTEQELQPTRINTLDAQHWTLHQDRFVCPLFQSTHEKTFLEKLTPHQILSESQKKGIEILVIHGQIVMDSQVYQAGSWLRLPYTTQSRIQATDLGATLYIKTGHLKHAMEVWGHSSA